MPTWAWIVIAVVALVIVIGAIAAWMQQGNAELSSRSGLASEYDRTVSEEGDRRAAEKDLADRERKRERLDIVPLSPEAQSKYSESWREVQGQFVDDPADAVNEADGLVTSVMRDRGYPIDDFDQRAEDISVDHPEVVENYRAAHAVYVKAANDNGAARGTEDLRQGFVHYRALFTELLDTNEAAAEQEAKR